MKLVWAAYSAALWLAVGCESRPDCFGPLHWEPHLECLGLQDPSEPVCVTKGSSDGVRYFCGAAPNHEIYVFAGTTDSEPQSGDWAIVSSDGARFGAPLSGSDLATCERALALWTTGFTPCSEVTDAGVVLEPPITE